MDTKSTGKPKRPNTDYQLHVAHLELCGHDTSNVVDFTERRLINLIRRSRSNRIQRQVLDVLQSYREGSIAIAWAEGMPMYHNIDRHRLNVDAEEA